MPDPYVRHIVYAIDMIGNIDDIIHIEEHIEAIAHFHRKTVDSILTSPFESRDDVDRYDLRKHQLKDYQLMADCEDFKKFMKEKKEKLESSL